MRRFIHRHRPLLGSCLIVVIGFAAVLIITALTTQNHRAVTKAHLIPAVTIYHAVPTGGGPIWGGETWVPSPFRRAQLHHPWCGRRISPQVRGIHGVYRMRFQHCTMAFGPIKVYRLPVATPLPEQGVVGGILGGTATPRPRHTPTAPPAISLPVPPATTVPVFPVAPTATRNAPPFSSTATPVLPTVQFELSLMNQSRASLGLPPYTLNPTESAGTATCPGSQGHADHMAQAGVISHDQFPADICIAYSTAGENVGEAGGYGVEGALDIIHQQMMAETPFSYGCTGSHRCNIMSPAFRQVGIGIATVNGTTFMAVDFIGP